MKIYETCNGSPCAMTIPTNAERVRRKRKAQANRGKKHHQATHQRPTQHQNESGHKQKKTKPKTSQTNRTHLPKPNAKPKPANRPKQSQSPKRSDAERERPTNGSLRGIFPDRSNCRCRSTHTSRPRKCRKEASTKHRGRDMECLLRQTILSVLYCCQCWLCPEPYSSVWSGCHGRTNRQCPVLGMT